MLVSAGRNPQHRVVREELIAAMSTARRVHVTCGANKKVITLSDVASAKQQVCDFFAVSTSSVLQIWDEGFQDFVDLENDGEIKNLSKLNVSIVREAPGSQNAVMIMQSPSSSPAIFHELTPRSLTAPSASNQTVLSTPSSAAQWPIVIQVPVHLFSPELRKVLESGCSLVDLKPKFRKQIQEAFFYDMSQYGL